jgi:hypothetical protein
VKREGCLIVVDLTDRLGNQLFKYAAAQQLELDGALVVFSNRTPKPFGGLFESPARLERFTGAKLPFASPRQELATGYLPPTHVRSERLGLVTRAPVVFPATKRVLRPTSFEARSTTLPTWSLYRIHSHFQHRSWFDRSLASVLNQIESATHDARAKLPTFDLCVSLRRSDYVAYGCDLSFDYYLRSLEMMSDRAIESVVVTSDDQLAARTFCGYLETKGYEARPSIDVRAVVDSGTDPIDPVLRDFCVITNSQNLIMSNSTFCWWAAKLGDVAADASSDRVVTYPRGWLEFQDDSSDGLVRPEWTVVSV